MLTCEYFFLPFLPGDLKCGLRTVMNCANVRIKLSSDVPGIGEFAPEVGWDKKTKSTVNGHHTADFVCAIRLVKIAKSGLRSNWTMKTVTRK